MTRGGINKALRDANLMVAQEHATLRGSAPFRAYTKRSPAVDAPHAVEEHAVPIKNSGIWPKRR
jgi:hypothetical protein